MSPTNLDRYSPRKDAQFGNEVSTTRRSRGRHIAVSIADFDLLLVRTNWHRQCHWLPGPTRYRVVVLTSLNCISTTAKGVLSGRAIISMLDDVQQALFPVLYVRMCENREGEMMGTAKEELNRSWQIADDARLIFNTIYVIEKVHRGLNQRY